MENFGNFIKARLRELLKSQKELALELGVSPAYISQILTGKKQAPDLSRPKNKRLLRIWSVFLETPEEELLERVRYELHKTPPRPDPKHPNMRRILLERLVAAGDEIRREIRNSRLHTAETRTIDALTGIYLILQEQEYAPRAHGVTRFRNMRINARMSSGFVESTLVGFFRDKPFTWKWFPDLGESSIYSDSPEINEAMEKIRDLLDGDSTAQFGRTVPVVGHASAGEGFEYTDGGYDAGEGFEQVTVPPGIDPALASRIYCVRVRGDSLQPSFGDGALLFIKPESYNEIRDGDLVIFKDREKGLAFVKKVEFAGENLVLHSLNPRFKNLVRKRKDLTLLEKVRSVVFP
jgi:phage repressor protein C with HTH and peptisase S24 domain/transcriptional regulator with XRE-family HTH domain